MCWARPVQKPEPVASEVHPPDRISLNSGPELEIWPEAPHDPRERFVEAELRGWELRLYQVGEPKERALAVRGLLHAQLWHPGLRVSLLTPSHLTYGQYEVCRARNERWRSWHYRPLRAMFRHFEIDAPSEHELAMVERWFVQRRVRELLRSAML